MQKQTNHRRVSVFNLPELYTQTNKSLCASSLISAGLCRIHVWKSCHFALRHVDKLVREYLHVSTGIKEKAKTRRPRACHQKLHSGQVRGQTHCRRGKPLDLPAQRAAERYGTNRDPTALAFAVGPTNIKEPRICPRHGNNVMTRHYCMFAVNVKNAGVLKI